MPTTGDNKMLFSTRGFAVITAVLVSTPSLAEELTPEQERTVILNSLVGAIRRVEQEPRLKYSFAWKNVKGDFVGGIGITQIIPSSLKDWSAKCLGQALTPEEYVGNVRAQLDLSYCVIGHLWDRYHDARVVASCWNSGRTDFNDEVPRDKLLPDTNVKKYVSRFLREMEGGGRPQLARFSDWKSESKSCKW